MTPNVLPCSYTPLVKVVSLRAAPDEAFRRFTAELGTWWPLRSHSVGEGQAASASMEGFVGGRIVERLSDGSECVWGTLTAWEPPARVAFTWHPGRGPESAQDVEVLFTPEGTGTRVQLTHRGFERLGAEGGRARRVYPLGWTYVLGLYAERRGPAMWLLQALTAALVAVRARHGAARRSQGGA